MLSYNQNSEELQGLMIAERWRKGSVHGNRLVIYVVKHVSKLILRRKPQCQTN